MARIGGVPEAPPPSARSIGRRRTWFCVGVVWGPGGPSTPPRALELGVIVGWQPWRQLVADWTLNTWSPLLISFSVCQEVTHCPLAAVARERLASFSPALSVVELSDIKNYFDIVQHKQESLIQKSPSNPSDLREEAEYVLQHQQYSHSVAEKKIFNNSSSSTSKHY